MMMLLMEFGVPTTIKEVVGRGKYAGRKYYVLRVPESFRDKVGYSGDYGKHDEIVRVPVPEYHVRRSTLGISCAKRLLEHLSKIVHSDLFWDIIEKIEEAGTEEVYDLSVKDNENFVTDQGILLHNSAKSLFLLCIESIPGAKYVIGSRASKAGISDYLINYKPRILLIDEFDKMHIQDIAVLLSMMETGRVSEMLYGKTREVELDTVVFAAANTMKGLPPEAKSRFQILHFTEYSEDEFKQVVVNVLKRRGVDEDLAQYIAQRVWSTLGSKDPREAIRIAKLASTKEEVDEVIDVLKRRR
jgi:Holliday junction DNA helicase RuvB